MVEIKELLRITDNLRMKYDDKLDFSLDGRLVGDIGEALVSEKYDIELHGKNAQVYDGYQRGTNKKVQIKSSFKYNFNYPYSKDLDYYIAVHIEPDGELEVIFNGPGKIVHDFLKGRKRKTYKDIWYTISANHLKMLNEMVKEEDRIHPINT
ncbi:hypothetical protein GCM10007103_30620 [Salinimicrobium marinum]|uniref:DUF6998 domain-containing protein n=1 Tax=Salinimicrobium marinum TaxID=680283 RepID=A0A918SJF7_9FLAO|nr:hypothetical protein [Salinimicrobium marinum]GHA47556.1 hypothetical protein GCM10007103_30620 [Salinimicrobium marinum]